MHVQYCTALLTRIHVLTVMCFRLRKTSEHVCLSIHKVQYGNIHIIVYYYLLDSSKPVMDNII